MSADRPLVGILRHWGLRLRLVQSLTWGLWGGVAGLSLALALALAARLWPLVATRWLIAFAGSFVLMGVGAGVWFAWLWPRSRHRLARTFDRHLGLAERMTTAVEIGAGRLRTTQSMAGAQLADAIAAARRVDLGLALPLRASRRALSFFGALSLVLTLLLWLPNPQERVRLQRAALREAIEEQIEDLASIQEAVREAEGLTEAEREMLLQALEEAVAGLEDGQATPEEAVAALSEAEQALAELQDPGAEAVREGLERAGDGLADSDLTQDISEALANGDFEAAAGALAAYGSETGEQLTREEELELARELADAAQALADSDPELAQQLAEAAGAIERGDIAEAREAIRQAAGQMGEAGERVERQETIEEALAELQEGRQQVAEAGGVAPGSEPGPAQAGAGGQGSEAGGQQGGQQTSPGHHEDAGTGAPYDEVYVPGRFGEEGEGVNVGREGEGGVAAGDVPLPAPQDGQATVPYREVYADYADEAGAALEGSYIPLGLKQYVRDYFSSLEP